MAIIIFEPFGSSLPKPPHPGPHPLPRVRVFEIRNDNYVGDCMLHAQSSVVLVETGQIGINWVTRSSDTNDTWNGHFEFFDESGASLGVSGDDMLLAHMSDSNEDYHFSWLSKVEYDVVRDRFPEIAIVQLICDC